MHQLFQHRTAYSSIGNPPCLTGRIRTAGGVVTPLHAIVITRPTYRGLCSHKSSFLYKPGHVLLRFVSKGIFAPFDEPDSPGVPASPLLITPVRQKKYNMYETTINSLWSKAADLFSSASKVVVVGYSFPSTDDRACELIGTALSARPGEIAIEIVAPDATAIISRIGDGPLSKAKSITPREMKFEEYIHVLAGDAPRLMKKAASEYTEVREWVKRIYALNKFESYPIKIE